MIPQGPAALTAVSRFLAAEILPAVPDALTGELRAAIKILETAADELNALPSLLQRECRELADIREEALRVLRGSATPVELPPFPDFAKPILADAGIDLHTLSARHTALLDDASRIIEALQRQAGHAEAAALLAQYFTLFERHALSRLPWQAVFAEPFDVEPPR